MTGKTLNGIDFTCGGLPVPEASSSDDLCRLLRYAGFYEQIDLYFVCFFLTVPPHASRRSITVHQVRPLRIRAMPAHAVSYRIKITSDSPYVRRKRAVSSIHTRISFLFCFFTMYNNI